MTFTEIYRDDYLLVINKPAGLPSQRTKAGEEGVYELLSAHEDYVGLHHRLDRRASGLMVLTVHRSANKAMARAFRKHQVQRVYVALCEGEVHNGRWDSDVDGKPARTDVLVIGPYGDGLTAIECRLHTGRTHQIRIHAAMNGTPLAGDRTYGGDASRPWERLGLHAGELSLRHPTTGEAMTWSVAPTW